MHDHIPIPRVRSRHRPDAPNDVAHPLAAPRAARRARSRSAALFLLLAIPPACSGDSSGHTLGGSVRRSSAGTIELASAPYRVREVTTAGSIAGIVEIDGDLPADSVVATTIDQDFCGSAFPDSSIIRSDRALGNVVVWLSDVRDGKPLPVERRTEILNDRCQLEPRVQAVVAGTTVNVRNEDRLPHTTRFTRAGAGDSLALVPLTDDGQVVPNEHIAAKSGLVAVSCALHPWTRGWIAVFESPYFAVTDARGTFRLDSVPPGKYHLVAWHERGTKQVEQEVQVRADGETKVGVAMRLR